jgi:hypothetical protein
MNDWMPLVLCHPVTYVSFVVYIVIEYGFRALAAYRYPPAKRSGGAPLMTPSSPSSPPLRLRTTTLHLAASSPASDDISIDSRGSSRTSASPVPLAPSPSPSPSLSPSAAATAAVVSAAGLCTVPGCPLYDASAGAQRMIDKHRDVFGRWTPSWIHAFLCTLGCALFYFEVIAADAVMAHTCGYFLADMVVDRDPEYIVHHFAPVFACEVLLRISPAIRFGLYALGIVEGGNVVQHTASIATSRTGRLFHRTVAIVLWTSRPLSWYAGFMTWYADVPEVSRYSWTGLGVLAAVLVTYAINMRWMVNVLKPRTLKPVPAGHVHEGVVGPPPIRSRTDAVSSPIPHSKIA